MKIRSLLLILVLAAGVADSSIEAPDHVIYGEVTIYGDPAASGQVIRAQLMATGEVLAQYTLGQSARLGGQYALRIPMSALEPRLEGRARPGDPIQISVGGGVVAETIVGKEGKAVRLDLDPQSQGEGPSVEVSDVELFEGNSGTSSARFDVVINSWPQGAESVELQFQTVDDTAVGGSGCTGGIDFIEANSAITIAPGVSATSFSVEVCGDNEVEAAEFFSLNLQAIRGVLEQNAVTVTIIDDDDVPTLRLADEVFTEPAAGTTKNAVFTPTLSKRSDFEARFAWSLQPLNAVPGVNYVNATGTGKIAAGNTETKVSVSLMNDGVTADPRSFRLVVSDPFNLIVDDSTALGVIQDPNFARALDREQQLVNQQDGLTKLSGPTALALSPDGNHAYVTSESLDAIVAFSRNPSNGHLQLIQQYDVATSGFDLAALDGPLHVVVSPDGTSVYVAASNDNAIAVFERNAGSGALTFVENQTQGVAAVQGLGGVSRLLIDADGEWLYAAGRGANSVAVFQRDASSGGLSFVDVESNGVDDADDSGSAPQGMTQPSGLAISPDGGQLYVASRGGNSIQVFDRAAEDGGAGEGALSFREAYIDGLLGVENLVGAFGIVVSEGGEHVYVTAEQENAIILFDRASDGSLSAREIWRREPASLPGLQGAQGVAMTPDGLDVFVAGLADNSLTVFERMQPGNEYELAHGDLRLRQTVFDDAGAITSMAGPTDVAVSADNEHVYVVANLDNAIVVFRRISPDELFGNGFE